MLDVYLTFNEPLIAIVLDMQKTPVPQTAYGCLIGRFLL
jgi:hypothetical protein